MRMFTLPLVLLLATCAGIQPPARSHDPFRLHRHRHCEACEKNDSQRRGMRGAALLPTEPAPEVAAAADRRTA